MTTPPRLQATLLCSAALLLAAPAASADDGFALDPVYLAKSKREVQTDTATAETVVDAQEIEDRQAGTIAELVDSVPGVNLINGGSPLGSGINIRGFGANATYGSDQKVKIQVDGASVGSEELYRIGTQLFTDPELYKQVTVIRGMAGTFEYGSGIIGGLIRLETKDAEDFTGGEVGLRYHQMLQFGVNGSEIVSSSILAWQPTERLGFIANYTYRSMGVQSDGKGNAIGTEGFETPSWSLGAKYRFGAGNAQYLRFSLTDTRSAERDVPYDSFGLTSGYFGNVDRDIHTKTATLSWGYDAPGNDLLHLSAVLAYADQQIDQEGVSGQTGGLATLVNADNRYRTTTLTLKNRMHFTTGSVAHDARVGVEYIFKRRLDAYSAPGGTDKRLAVFAVDDMTIGGLTLTPALRYETQRVGGPGYAYYDNDALMGGLSARYGFGNGWAVFASAAYSANLPIIDDLTNPTYMTQAERARSFEIGFSYDRSSVLSAGDELSVKVNAYSTELWDITSYTSPAMMPLTDAKLHGIEIEAAYSLPSGFYIDLNGNIARGRTTTPGLEGYWEGVPADELRVTFGKRWGERLDLSWEMVADAAMDRTSTPSAGFAVHNLRATIRPEAGILAGSELRVSVENLFDLQYTPHLATRPAAGRTLKLSLSRTF